MKKKLGLPVRDARKNEAFEFEIAPAHCRKAIKSDPERCILALAAKGIQSVHQAVIGSRIAYFVFDQNPKECVRFEIDANSRGLTRIFDLNTNEIKRNPGLVAGKVVRMVQPTETLRLDAPKRPHTGGPVRTNAKTLAQRKRARQTRKIGFVGADS